jgi:hypothetical protein
LQINFGKTKKIKPEQISLDLKKDKLEGYYTVKRKLAYMEATVEALPYWKNFLSVLAFMLFILLIVFNFYVVISKYKELPRELPLIYSQSNNTWNLIDKEFYLLIPFVLLVALFFLIRFNTLTFKFDRRLATMINLTLILTSLLAFIAYIQLFSFVLIY